jgi:outer membrane protein TolC
LSLDSEIPVAPELRLEVSYVEESWARNPEILVVQEAIKKAKAAVAAAKAAYIPDVSACFTNAWQNGVPFAVRDASIVGARVSWDVLDFGKRCATVRERESRIAKAKENLGRLKDDVALHVKQSYYKLTRAKSLLDVAVQVAEMRRESDRLARNQSAEGVVTVADWRHTSAAVYTSKVELLQATLNCLLAWAELEGTVGRIPDLQQSPAGRNSRAR